MQHVVHTEIYKALEAAGISIPFPQTDLNIVSQEIPLEFTSEKGMKKRPVKVKAANIDTPKPKMPKPKIVKPKAAKPKRAK